MPREKKIHWTLIFKKKKKRHQPYFIIGQWTYKEQSNLAMIKNIKCNKKIKGNKQKYSSSDVHFRSQLIDDTDKMADSESAYSLRRLVFLILHRSFCLFIYLFIICFPFELLLLFYFSLSNYFFFPLSLSSRVSFFLLFLLL